ncbi:MAG: hypothetical protein GEU93_05970 [Propionibacteriales bacterium]|nr:hypothetical protein [Propionibacteriales bacterium]
MTDLSNVVLTIHGPGTAAGLLDVVTDVYADAFGHATLDADFERELKFLVDSWPRRLTSPGFRLVVAAHENDAIGAVYGHELMPDGRWWEGENAP